MAEDGENTRVVVRCVACGSVYPAWKWPDGGVSLIGREFCPCGSRELKPVHADE